MNVVDRVNDIKDLQQSITGSVIRNQESQEDGSEKLENLQNTVKGKSKVVSYISLDNIKDFGDAIKFLKWVFPKIGA